MGGALRSRVTGTLRWRFAVVGLAARLEPTGAFLRNARGFELFG
mgnify:CR=1 FL=1|jgi:hypothetical protein